MKCRDKRLWKMVREVCVAQGSWFKLSLCKTPSTHQRDVAEGGGGGDAGEREGCDQTWGYTHSHGHTGLM